jgi:hypothetical protein
MGSFTGFGTRSIPLMVHVLIRVAGSLDPLRGLRLSVQLRASPRRRRVRGQDSPRGALPGVTRLAMERQEVTKKGPQAKRHGTMGASGRRTEASPWSCPVNPGSPRLPGANLGLWQVRPGSGRTPDFPLGSWVQSLNREHDDDRTAQAFGPGCPLQGGIPVRAGGRGPGARSRIYRRRSTEACASRSTWPRTIRVAGEGPEDGGGIGGRE